VLKHIAIRRFKKFQNLELELRPLTVLTGCNGGGKTSLIQSLLLVHQAERARKNAPPIWVQLNGPFGLQLGDGPDVLHHGSSIQSVEIVLSSDSGDERCWQFEVLEERVQYLTLYRPPKNPLKPLGSHKSSFTYLGAERLGPRDVLGTSSVDVNHLNVGHQGEFVAHVLAVLERQTVEVKRCLPGVPQLLRHQVESWMSIIVDPIQIQAQWLPGASVTQLQFKRPGLRSDWVRPPNMGFGISYSLPIVTAGLMMGQGGILIVENPEAHLHPAAQSRIGEFLARIAGTGVQVLLETHSDHVINGIRRNAVIGPIGVALSDVIFHFFRPDSPGVISPTLTPSGGLSDWPEGFFDQQEKDLSVLARVRKKPSVER